MRHEAAPRCNIVASLHSKFPPFFGQVMKPRFMVGLQSKEGGEQDGADAENTFRGVQGTGGDGSNQPKNGN